MIIANSCRRILTRAGLDRASWTGVKGIASPANGMACKAIWLNDEIIIGLKTIDSCLHERLTSLASDALLLWFLVLTGQFVT